MNDEAMIEREDLEDLPTPVTINYYLTVETQNYKLTEAQRRAAHGAVMKAMGELHVRLALMLQGKGLTRVYLDVASPQTGTHRILPGDIPRHE